jgi:KUP system potassium uptake protein
MQTTVESSVKHSLLIGAIGIVFGDIGTSPLYALHEVFAGSHPLAINEENIFSILSILIWSLILIVTGKYCYIVMRADNEGEGGIMSLLAMVGGVTEGTALFWVIPLGVIGTALFYGDSVITPAISVISAMEGIELISPHFKEWIVPATLAIIVPLYLLQSKGTDQIAKLFGPIMLLWFLTCGILGISKIVEYPRILLALNPYYAVHFLIYHSYVAFLSLGGIVLVLTGAEALYADIGHFSRKIITKSWHFIVLPCLVLNYAGQGALLLETPTAIENPWYLLAPHSLLIPLVILASFATIIASQAVISGTFSMTKQAITAGYLPRMTFVHTSDSIRGQVYLPMINWFMVIVVVCLVVIFKSSANLAAAYGIAVTGTMMITTILTGLVALQKWHIDKMIVISLMMIICFIDLCFFGSNAVKIMNGGYVPLIIASILTFIMLIWHKKHKEHIWHNAHDSMNMEDFLQSLSHVSELQRPSGLAIHLAASSTKTPRTLLHNMVHNRVVHDHILLVSVKISSSPMIEADHHIEEVPLSNDRSFKRVIAHYGYMDRIDLPRDIEKWLANSSWQSLKEKKVLTTWFTGHDILISDNWVSSIYSFLFRNAASVNQYFNLPLNNVVEWGVQYKL